MTIPMPKRAERYDRLAALRTDERFTNGHSDMAVREFIEAVYWSQWTTGDSGWAAIKTHLGRRHIASHWRMLLRADLPRWEPFGGQPSCEHILTGGPRKGEECGKPRHLGFRITNPDNGEWRTSSWCSKHHDEGRSAQWREQHRAGRDNDPAPNPNRGGVLPCYLDLSNGGSWVDKYRAVQPGWEPPKVGVCADAWPELAKVHPVTRRPKLALIVGDVS